MPFLDSAGIPIGLDSGQVYQPTPVTEPTYTTSDVFRAAARQENIIGSIGNRHTWGISNDPEEGFNVWSEIKGTKYEYQFERMATAQNKKYFEALKRQLDMEEEDKKMIQRSGWTGTLASILMGTVDPTILLPGGAAVRGARGTWSASKSALSIGAGALAGAAVQEGILQGTQSTRTLEESAISLGSSFVLGGLVGAGVASMLSRAEIKAMEQAYTNVARFTRTQGGAGADVTDLRAVWEKAAREDFNVEGVAGSIRAGLQISPTDRLGLSPSVTSRAVTASLVDDPLVTVAAKEGRQFLGVSAESLARSQSQSMIAHIAEQQAKIYQEMVKSGTKMPTDVFDKEVGRALMQGDVHVNPYVQRTAVMLRKEVFDPLLARAQEVGLLPRGMTVKNAESYFPIMLDEALVKAREPEFKARIEPAFRQLILDEFQNDRMRVMNADTKAQRRIEALTLTREQRDRKLKKLEKEIAELRDTFEFRAASDLKDEAAAIRQQMRKLRQADEGTATVGVTPQSGLNEVQRQMLSTDLPRRLKEIEDELGDDLSGVLALDRSLRAQRRTLTRRGFVGAEDRVAKLEDELTDLYEATEQSVLKASNALRKVQDKITKLDDSVAPEVLQEHIRRAVKDFDRLEESMLRAIEKERKAEAKLKAEEMQSTVDVDGKTNLEKIKKQADEARDLAPLREAKAKAIARQEKLLEQFSEVRQRLLEAEQPDIRAAKAELEQLLRDVLQQKTGLILDKAEHIQKLLEKIEKADPALVAKEIERLQARAKRAEDRFIEKWQDKPKSGEAGIVDLVEWLRSSRQTTETVSEAQPMTYRTAKGSTYTVHEDGTTTRNKAARNDAGHEGDSGIKEKSAQTVYLPREAIEALSEVTATTGRNTWRIYVDKANQTVNIVQITPDGKIVRTKETWGLRFENEPRIGLHPYEMWHSEKLDGQDVFRKVHPGNEITEIIPARVATTRERATPAPTVNLDPIVRQAVDDHVDLRLGRIPASDEPLAEFMTSIVRGPLRDRTAPYRHEDIFEFTHHDASAVAARYARVVNGEIAIKEKLGTMPNMKEVFEKIAKDYATVRGQIDEAQSRADVFAALGRSEGLIEKWRNLPLDQLKEKARLELDAKLRQDNTDMRAVRDILRGTYKVQENSSDWGRIANGINMVQYLRLGGRFGIASLPDLYRPAMVHGLTNYFADVARTRLFDAELYKLAKEEARLAGLVVEGLTHHRLYSMAEIGNTIKSDTSLERLLRNGTHVMSKFNGLNFLQNMGESASSILNMNKMLRDIESGKVTPYLANLGIGEKELARMQAQLQHMTVRNDVRVAGTEKWTDQKAVRDFRAALNRAVSYEIIRPTISDKPLFGYTPLGRLFLLFRSFGLAAHQKVMLKGLQDGPGRFISGLTGMVTAGMMVAYLKALSGGEERFEKFKAKVLASPGYLVGEGLDNSGVLPLIFEFANTTEKFTQAAGHSLNPIKTPLQALFGGAPSESERNFNRSVLEAIAGPASGLPSDIARAFGGSIGVTSGDPSMAQKRAVAGILPFSNAIIVKEILQVLTGDSPYMRH